MRGEWRFFGFLGMVVLAASFVVGCPPTVEPGKPEMPDKSVVRAFEAKGIGVPETRMTASGANAGEMDLELIREAIAEAKELSQEEQERLQRPEGGERMRRRSMDETTAAEPEAVEARPEAAPRPEPRDMLRAVAETPRGLDMEQDKKEKEEAAEKPAADTGDGKPKETVLKRIAAAPRQAKILVRDEEGKLVPLETREIRVVAYLQGPRARTVVDTVFENKTDHNLQGTFYFPLPAEASPVGFAMFSGAVPADKAKLFAGGRALPRLPDDSSKPEDMDSFAPPADPQAEGPHWRQRQEARVVEQKRAREVYEEIVRKSIDPALLEWSVGNTFQARVFPIAPHSLKRVVLVYEQTLPFDGELLRYTFTLPEKKLPLPVSARVHVDERLGEVRAATMSADLRAVAPRGRKVGPWTAYDLVQEGEGGALSVAVAPAEARAHVIAGMDPGGLPGRTFFARLVPEIPEGVLDATGRALFVVDTSLSAGDNQAHELQSAMLEALLTRDDSISEYAVLLFDVRPRWLHGPAWRTNDQKNRKTSLAELRKVYLEGATSFDAVLTDLDGNLSWLSGGPRPAASIAWFSRR